jgi:hypothetical protein
MDKVLSELYVWLCTDAGTDEIQPTTSVVNSSKLRQYPLSGFRDEAF